MIDRVTSPTLPSNRCTICGHVEMTPLAQRSDGKMVVRCDECGMGVLEHIPDDLMSIYGDEYYGGAHEGSGKGYQDYAYTAEHGVGWAAALVCLLRPEGGRVLDIGCADGYLLAKLGSRYERCGIEVNETLGQRAVQNGVSILGRDLLDPALVSSHEGSFDVITAIAVFEHLCDFRAAVEAAVRLLKKDGLLIFEVPMMSERHDNSIWFKTSLEHVWYPSEEALRRLIELKLGGRLIGSELHIRDYGSTYVGVVSWNVEDTAQLRALVERVVSRRRQPVSAEEEVARMLLHVIHAANPTHDGVGTLANFQPMMLNRPMLRRLVELWQADLRQLQQVRDAYEQEAACARRLQADLATMVSDRRVSQGHLASWIAAIDSRLRTIEAASAADGDELGRQRSSLIACQDAVEAEGIEPLSNETYLRSQNSPLVSVVIPCFNYGHFVADAVDSVLNQTFRDLEVIIVEGGSSDVESRRLVAELDRPRTRVLFQGEGHLAGANRNFGISRARGKYVCCLDADDLLRPTYIEKAVFLLERHGYDVVSCAIETFGDSLEFYYYPLHPDLEALLDNNQVVTCAVFRRTLWEHSGGFHDSDRSEVGYVYEDWSFWVRLAALGARFINMERDPQLLYRVHNLSTSRQPNVLPMERQRELIREMNSDVIDDSAILRSRRIAYARGGTPPVQPPELYIDRLPALANRWPTLLLATPYLILGGAERLLSALVGHLVGKGWRVVIVTSVAPSAQDADRCSWFEPHTQEIFHLPRFLLRDYWDDFLRHLIASREVNLLWVAGSVHAYDRLRSLRAEFPHLRVVDSLFNIAGHAVNNRRRRVQIDLTLVENLEVRGWLLENGAAETEVKLIESGVDLDRLRPSHRSAELVQQINALPNDLIVGFAGRWSEEKDPLAFVEIARRVDGALPIRFVMTGAGRLRSAIERAVANANFPTGRFHVLGEVDDIASVLSSLDLLVVPSLIDGRPMVVMEALALGVPVLASRVGGLPDMIKGGETGWLSAPGDLETFVRRIREAASFPERLAAMRIKARAFAEANFNAKTMIAAYHDALAGLLPTDHPYRGQ